MATSRASAATTAAAGAALLGLDQIGAGPGAQARLREACRSEPAQP